MGRKKLSDDVLAEESIPTPEQIAVVKQAGHGKTLEKPPEAQAETPPSAIEELKAKAKAGRKRKKASVTKRTTLDLPEDIDRKFKQFCRDAGESKQSVLERLVRELVSD